MTRLTIRLLRWGCDPAKLEGIEGDLLELYGGRTTWSAVRDVISVVLLHSRFTTAAARRRLTRFGLVAGAAAVLVFAGDPLRAAPTRYFVSASDPAGSFTLAFENQRIVSATFDNVPIDPTRFEQSGSSLVIKGADGGRDFRVSVRPLGGISWKARQR